MIALIRNTCQKGKDVINMEKVVKKEPYGSVTRQKSVHQMKSRNNTICLSSGTGLDSKLLYDEGK